jgi:undecaprenyl-diphosphatase
VTSHRPSIAVIAWLAVLIAFCATAALASAHDRFPADEWLADQAQSLRLGAMEDVLEASSDAAAAPWVLLVAAAAGAYLIWRGQQLAAAIMLLTVPARGLVWLFKELIERPRPAGEFVRVQSDLSDFSFPSGHSFNAVLVFGLVAYFAALYVRPTWLRMALQATCLWVVLATGFQRVYFGYHWPSDVAGGFLLAGLALTAAVAVHRAGFRTPLARKDATATALGPPALEEQA